MAQKQKKGKRTPAYSTDTMIACLVAGLMLIALGVLTFLANALNLAGDVFDGLRHISRGMCGMMSIVLPVIPIWGGMLVIMSIQRKPPLRPFLLGTLLLALLCAAATLLTFVVSTGRMPLLDHFKTLIYQTGERSSVPAYLTRAFDIGSRRNIGGGLLGTLLAWPLWTGIGTVLSAILVILAALVDFLFLIRLDVKGITAGVKRRLEERRTQHAAQEAAQRQQELAWQQEQMRRQQEQRRLQEQMQQQMQQSQPVPQPAMPPQPAPQMSPQPVQPYMQPGYAPLGYEQPSQAVPIVKQVQTRGQKRRTPQHGFQPTPEELGQAPEIPQPAPEPPRKKRGGVFTRGKGDDAVAIPRKHNFFDQAPEEYAPVQPDWTNAPAQEEPVFPSEMKETPAASFVPDQPEPEMDEPDFLFTPEPEIFTEPAPQPVTPPAPPVKPAAARRAAAPAKTAPQPVPASQPVSVPQPVPASVPARKVVAPPEEVDDGFAAEAAEKPVNENSFLARLRAAKKQAGLEVPENDAPVRPAQEPAKPRPAARVAPQPESSQDDWADTPPWEESPAPAVPAAPKRPVVTQKKPEGGYEPELNLKPRRSGSNPPAAPLFDAPADSPYVFPSMDLLKSPEPQQGFSEEEDAMRSRRLENTLQSFRVPAKVRHITHGPAISRFELELAAGIKVSKVTDLNRNIAMNMEVKSVRIEAPIPGKSLVGVEVPNKQRATVTLREVLESDAMRKADKPLIVALGKDIAGVPILCDLAKMPHLLIAGATGSGKSVCINTIINSLLYRCSPKDVRLILVDPKVVELQCYNGIPHLLIPVVSDPHKASGALAWAVGEMMDRYTRFQAEGVRNIEGYNERMPEDDRMARIVIVIDELADLMMTCKKDVEERICRLAQLARAAGIHLIVATQRPSTDVITGLIKANIPSRIAFKVSSNVDSRTILDRIGAEQLLGYGDMLYLPMGEFAATRIQGCFLSDAEVNRITDFIRENCPSDYDPAILEELDRLQQEANQESNTGALPELITGDENPNSDSHILTQCIEMAVQDGQISTSMIQRRLRLGYTRAARMTDEMEKLGIIGPKDGAKPRMCMISREEFEAMKATGELD